MAVGRVASGVRIAQRAAELFALAVAPVFVNAALLVDQAHVKGGVAYDFRRAFLPAARAVMHGRSPFGPATAAALRPATAFVYPPFAAFVYAPFTWMPTQVAAYAVSILTLACVPATLRALGVRDWRCYGAALLWAPVVSSIRFGAVSLPLALLLALVWRYRSRVAPVATALGAAVALKLFVWPLVVWLAATRRRRTAAAASVAAAALVVLPWAAIGFAGLREYPHLLRVLSSIEGPESYTVAAMLGSRLGEIAGYAAGALVLAAAVRAGRRGDDRATFVLAIAAALVLSPIVWMHYFAILLVPVAIMSPSFGPAWVLPLALFAFPVTPGAASWQEIAATLSIAAATLLSSAGTMPEWRLVRPATTS